MDQTPRDYRPPVGPEIDTSKCIRVKKSGKQCGNKPMAGQRICHMHGGTAPQNLRKAAERIRAEEAKIAVSKLGARKDVLPGDALLEEVQWTAGHIQYAREQLELAENWLEAIDLGVIPADLNYQVKGKETDHQAARRAALASRSAWRGIYDRERNHLVYVSAATIRAGVEERRVAIAEQQGLLFAGVVKRILNAMMQALLDRGFTVDDIWAQLVSDIVPREFRQLQIEAGSM